MHIFVEQQRRALCRRNVVLSIRRQAALDASHQAAEEVLQRTEARHAEALGSVAAARDAASERLAATEAEFRQALQVRRRRAQGLWCLYLI